MSKEINDFQYCDMCKLNHTKGNKHVYSQKHKIIVEKILDKFLLRISDGLKVLEEPAVEDISDAIERKFWCYFCECDVSVHQTSDLVLLQFFGMLNHLSSESHLIKVNTFWRRNRLDKNLIPKYYIMRETFEMYAAALTEKHKEFMEKRNSELTKDAIVIKSLETERMKLVQETIQMTPMNDPAKSSALPTFNNPDVKIPPWLQPDSDSSSAIIGPSKEDFDKHMAKKRPLPANRIGANFDHTATTSAEWLPMFGRVWNNGRRLQSKYEFSKKNKRKRST